MDGKRVMTASGDNLKFEFPDRDSERLLRELILYISEQCADDKTFSATKLNKILFFADFLAFAKYGEPLTGVSYTCQEYGPVPERLLPIRTEMQANQEIAVRPTDFYTLTQHRTIALREADLSLFTGQQIALLDHVIDSVRGMTAREVSNLSHQMPGWKVAHLGQRIPYNAVFLSTEPVTVEDVLLTEQMAREYGW